MDSTDDPDDSSGSESKATEMHDNSWSVNLEKPKYDSRPELAVSDGLDAIDRTVRGNHVNLVTHASLGHPDSDCCDYFQARVAVSNVSRIVPSVMSRHGGKESQQSL